MFKLLLLNSIPVVTVVSAATRAVAMKENITYGAAQLLSTIKLGTGVGTTTENALVDNASDVSGGSIETNVFDGSSAEAEGVLFSETGM